jgi:hypothetical protein
MWETKRLWQKRWNNSPQPEEAGLSIRPPITRIVEC